MKASSLLAAVGASTVLAVVLAGTPGKPSPVAAATAPPTPPPIAAPATPPVSPVSAPGTPGPAASVIPMPGITPSPATTPLHLGKTKPSPPPRKGIDGVWEVEIQHATSTDYSHFALTQQGDAISGTYLDSKGKKYPVAGSVDGQSIRLIVTMPNGTTLLLEGKLDGTSDMIGMLTSPDGQVPFTAAYRAKQSWIENVNPSPGGIPSQGGYTPPRKR